MNAAVDIFGEQLNIDDYILAPANHGSSSLYSFKIIGFTPQGALKLRAGTCTWARTQLWSVGREGIKISKDQAEYVAKQNNYEI